MSVSHIPENVKIRLWGKSGGRCQYEGCNKPLWLDSLTKAEFNTAYIAHIIADRPDGPRGDPELSRKLGDDITNLMLMCDEHHRLIDLVDIGGHPINRLRKMKSEHEERIAQLTSISKDKKSHVLLFGANIGEQHAPLNWDSAAISMVPKNYPAESQAIELSLKNSPFEDHEKDYWQIECENLNRQFVQLVRPRLAHGDVRHFSIFALAPQPLLMELGKLLSDIPAADVYQLHREPPGWTWQESPIGFEFVIKKPDKSHETIVLNLSLSATIDDSRIIEILGPEISIWTMTIQEPNNDFLKSREQLGLFRNAFRRLLDEIKSIHGQKSRLHIFPACPVSIAVEIGRVWMSKADMPMHVYDQNHQAGGFKKALEIR